MLRKTSLATMTTQVKVVQDTSLVLNLEWLLDSMVINMVLNLMFIPKVQILMIIEVTKMHIKIDHKHQIKWLLVFEVQSKMLNLKKETVKLH